MIKQAEPIALFLSYTDDDEELCDQLQDHLSLLRKQGLISTWYPRLVLPGTDWAHEVNEHLKSASIILLLISAKFFASDYCSGVEMEHALQRHEANEAQVVPILLRPVDWQISPIAKLRVLPQNARPVTSWPNQDLAFKDIAIQIRKIVEKLREPQHGSINEQVYRSGQPEYAHTYILQTHIEFRRCQKEVNELKSIHNMLHEIEMQLECVSATIQLILRSERRGRNISRSWFVKFKKDTFSDLDLNLIEAAWRQAALKINNLLYFAAEVMETLKDGHFIIESDGIKGASWAKDLFSLQQSFEVGIGERDIDVVQKLSNELLTNCRTHLYHIDRRLLVAVKALDLASSSLMKE